MDAASKPRRLYEIDLLRFIAALSVVFFHYGFRGYAADNLTSMPYLSIAPVAKYGYLGVNLFFIISGFVILMSASGGSARRFIVSRTVRLYPAFWASCTLTFIAIVVAGGTRYSASLLRYVINLTMLSEFVGVKPIDGAYWSLFIEMKFYLLVLVVLLLGQTHRAKELLGLWLALVLLASRWPIDFVDSFLIPDYAPYFIAGAMLYLVYAEGVDFYKLFVIATSYVFAVRGEMEKVAEMVTHYRSAFDATVIAVILAAIFMVLFLVALGRTGRFASEKWLLLGALTYPLYLIHQFVGYIIFNLAYPYLNAHLIMLGTLSLVLLAAYLVHTKVERRFAGPMKTFLERLLAVRPRPSYIPAEGGPAYSGLPALGSELASRDSRV